MKFFKTKPSYNAPRYEITPAMFEKKTNNKFPFEQISGRNRTISLYGICPSCLNPIQLIGMSAQSKINPYGKHTGKDIIGLPPWKQTKYEYCPFSEPNKHRQIDEDELLPDITEEVIELYNMLKDNFDRAVYVVQKSTDIRCTPNFWERSLKQYLENHAYLYPWLMDSNLPYIFAMKGMTHCNIYGQRVKTDSDLYEKLKKHKYINFVASNPTNDEYQIITSKGGYLNLEFRFTGHRQIAQKDAVLKECVQFCVDDLISGKTIYEKTIEFDETYFTNIINSPTSEQYRNKKLLEIANDLMKPLV